MEDVQSPQEVSDQPNPAQLPVSSQDAPTVRSERVSEMFAGYARTYLYGSSFAGDTEALNRATQALEKLKNEIVSFLEQ